MPRDGLSANELFVAALACEHWMATRQLQHVQFAATLDGVEDLAEIARKLHEEAVRRKADDVFDHL